MFNDRQEFCWGMQITVLFEWVFINLAKKEFYSNPNTNTFIICIQSRFIAGGPTAFKIAHTAPPSYLNSDLKGPLAPGVRLSSPNIAIAWLLHVCIFVLILRLHHQILLFDVVQCNYCFSFCVMCVFVIFLQPFFF